jgi:hypothetical protein
MTLRRRKTMELRLRKLNPPRDGVEYELALVEEAEETYSELILGTGKRKPRFPHEENDTIFIEIKPSAIAYLGLDVLKEYLPDMIRERL